MPPILTQPRLARILITTDAVGGVWTYSVALAACLAEAGISTTMAVLGPAPSHLQCLPAEKNQLCRVVSLGLPLDWQASSADDLDKVIDGLQKLLSEETYTSAHLHSPALAARPWPIPVVAVVHSCMATWWDEVERSPRPAAVSLHAKFCGAGLKLADSVIAPSQSFADAIRKAYDLMREISVVHNAVAEWPRQDVQRQDFVLLAGRLWDRGKNLAILEAAAQLITTPIVVAGSTAPPGDRAIIFKNVVYLGDLPQTALAEVMSRAMAFAAPSIYEPFGLAVLEAAHLATPLILADNPTFRELWQDAAIFISPNDAAAWASAISLLAGDAALARRLGDTAQCRARLYSLDRMATATMRHHRILFANASVAA